MHATTPRLVVVHRSAGSTDSITANAHRRVEALCQRGISAELRIIDGPQAGRKSWWTLAREIPDQRGPILFIEYNPFSYGRWGFAPWLIAAVARHKRRGGSLALMIHEPYVPVTSARSAAMGAWQRVQLILLRRGADAVFTSIEGWAGTKLFGRVGVPGVHLPLGSALSDSRYDRESRRRALLGPHSPRTLVLAALGTGHPGRLDDYVVAATNTVAASLSTPLALLNLGAGAVPLNGVSDGVVVITPGALPEQELASYLAAADIFLAPFSDGVSTRRSTLMAALQHALAVVATDGFLTDSMLREARGALTLAPLDREAYAAAAVRLASDDTARSRQAQAGRALYEKHFDWLVLAERLDRLLALSRSCLTSTAL